MIKTKLIHVVLMILMLGGLFSICFGQDRRYEANWESIDSRPTPSWYTDAKFGIFIHWGVYSVPSWTTKGNYAEWYWVYMNRKETAEFHAKNYGKDFDYRQFGPMFKAELFDAAEWADFFKRSGAGYIVLTSKHHDGYCLWPSEQSKGWNSVDVGPKRDLVGELTQAVNDVGIKMGLYYSLYEWYHPLYKSDVNKYVDEHMLPQLKDIVNRYHPALVWTDGEWEHPWQTWRSPEYLSWLFNESPVKDTVVVNDRWGKDCRHRHGGFYTTEYGTGLDGHHPWEECRGMGASFGYNRNETIFEYNSATDMIHMLVDTVSRGGNLLLDIGPTADGRIPVIMQERLVQIGDWLKVNGEAIYGTKKWHKTAEVRTATTKKLDKQIKFDWGDGELVPGANNNVMVCWTGYVQPKYSEEYTFYTVSDDGVRLNVDGETIILDWANHGPQETRGTIQLEAGKRYPIRLYYYEDTGGASLSLSWSSESQAREVIPQACLFSPDNKDGQSGDGLLGSYSAKTDKTVCYTCKGKGNPLYAISLGWPGKSLRLNLSHVSRDTTIELLGREGRLPWRDEKGKIIVDLSAITPDELPCESAYTFKLTGEAILP